MASYRDAQQTLGAQRAVDVDRPVCLGDAVLGQHHHGRPARQRGVEQRRDDCVQLDRGRDGLGRGRPVALEVVVEVRHVHEGQVGVVAGHDVFGGAADPL